MAQIEELEVVREYRFEAAHVLPWHPGKCARLHGHSYRVEVAVRGQLDDRGVVLEFDDLDHAVAPVIAQLDHRDLREVVANPTAERVVAWMFDIVSRALPGLAWLRLWETARSSVIARAR